MSGPLYAQTRHEVFQCAIVFLRKIPSSALLGTKTPSLQPLRATTPGRASRSPC